MLMVASGHRVAFTCCKMAVVIFGPALRNVPMLYLHEMSSGPSGDLIMVF